MHITTPWSLSRSFSKFGATVILIRARPILKDVCCSFLTFQSFYPFTFLFSAGLTFCGRHIWKAYIFPEPHRKYWYTASTRHCYFTTYVTRYVTADETMHEKMKACTKKLWSCVLWWYCMFGTSPSEPAKLIVCTLISVQRHYMSGSTMSCE